MRKTILPAHPSANGVRFTANFEGCVLHPYNDPAGNATIGFGHLIHHGPVTKFDLSHWGTISRQQALRLLRADMEVAATSVRTHVRPRLLSVPRFDAIVDVVFNIGTGAFIASTLLDRLNGSGYRRTGVQDEIMRWVYAGGVKQPGLVKRRGADVHLFTTGEYGFFVPSVMERG